MSSAGQAVTTRIQRSQNVVSRVVCGEAIVVPIRRGAADMDSIYTFNETGSLLWSLIEKGGTVEDFSAQLQSEYGITAEQAADDTAKFLQELKEAGLIEMK
ncbi:MAG TPA: PqqD family protein [Candidatus Acidoferrales bacterium]|nr:PqqD family protein [Candidatus Acidoferrales bacterium]